MRLYYFLIMVLISSVGLMSFGCISTDRSKFQQTGAPTQPKEKRLSAEEERQFLEKTNSLFVLGLRAEEKGDLKEAEWAYRNCIEFIKKQNTVKYLGPPYHRLAVIAARTRNTEKSEEYFRKALEHSKANAELACDFAQMLCDDRRPQEAATVLDNALIALPKNKKLLFFLGHTLAVQNREIEALRHLKKSINEADAYFEIADVLRERGNTSGADIMAEKGRLAQARQPKPLDQLKEELQIEFDDDEKDIPELLAYASKTPKIGSINQRYNKFFETPKEGSQPPSPDEMLATQNLNNVHIVQDGRALASQDAKITYHLNNQQQFHHHPPMGTVMDRYAVYEQNPGGNPFHAPPTEPLRSPALPPMPELSRQPYIAASPNTEEPVTSQMTPDQRPTVPPAPAFARAARPLDIPPAPPTTQLTVTPQLPPMEAPPQRTANSQIPFMAPSVAVNTAPVPEPAQSTQPQQGKRIAKNQLPESNQELIFPPDASLMPPAENSEKFTEKQNVNSPNSPENDSWTPKLSKRPGSTHEWENYDPFAPESEISEQNSTIPEEPRVAMNFPDIEQNGTELSNDFTKGFEPVVDDAKRESNPPSPPVDSVTPQPVKPEWEKEFTDTMPQPANPLELPKEFLDPSVMKQQPAPTIAQKVTPQPVPPQKTNDKLAGAATYKQPPVSKSIPKQTTLPKIESAQKPKAAPQKPKQKSTTAPGSMQPSLNRNAQAEPTVTPKTPLMEIAAIPVSPAKPVSQPSTPVKQETGRWAALPQAVTPSMPDASLESLTIAPATKPAVQAKPVAVVPAPAKTTDSVEKKFAQQIPVRKNVTQNHIISDDMFVPGSPIENIVVSNAEVQGKAEFVESKHHFSPEPPAVSQPMKVVKPRTVPQPHALAMKSISPNISSANESPLRDPASQPQLTNRKIIQKTVEDEFVQKESMQKAVTPSQRANESLIAKTEPTNREPDMVITRKNRSQDERKTLSIAETINDTVQEIEEQNIRIASSSREFSVPQENSLKFESDTQVNTAEPKLTLAEEQINFKSQEMVRIKNTETKIESGETFHLSKTPLRAEGRSNLSLQISSDAASPDELIFRIGDPERLNSGRKKSVTLGNEIIAKESEASLRIGQSERGEIDSRAKKAVESGLVTPSKKDSVSNVKLRLDSKNVQKPQPPQNDSKIRVAFGQDDEIATREFLVTQTANTVEKKVMSPEVLPLTTDPFWNLFSGIFVPNAMP